MKWEKLGRVYCVNNEAEWCVTHTANPWPEHQHDDIYRVYFSCRDVQNRSYVSYIEFDINTLEVTHRPTEKLLSPGEPGLFDDSGCSLGSIITTPEGERRLYYMGWHLTKVAPWGNFIGMAVYDESEKVFKKYSRVPIIDRTDADPFSINYPAILYENGIYRMWFASHSAWHMDDTEHDYGMRCKIKTGTSKDGIHWNVGNQICIEGKDESEYAFARLAVLHENGIYKMFYSYRGKKYRIGYAESPDGIAWIRKDEEVGIDVSAEGWDSDMIEYPAVFDHNGSRYMLYCGNGYGRSGFGIARLLEA